VLAALLDLVLPQPCAGCGAEGAAWCPACAAALAGVAESPLGPTRPDPTPPGFPPTAAAAAYAGPVRAALLAHKERGRLGLGRPLGRALAAAVGCLSPPPHFLLVPVPSSRAAVRERGHDHARRLARFAAAALSETGLQVSVRPALRAVRGLEDQAALGAASRAANLAGAFALSGGFTADLPVVVVDDVVTTGSSLVEATRVLTAAGVAVHGAATVGATIRRYGHGYRRTSVQ
jgi:predicted amidophosphoribosyltransferase